MSILRRDLLKLVGIGLGCPNVFVKPIQDKAISEIAGELWYSVSGWIAVAADAGEQWRIHVDFDKGMTETEIERALVDAAPTKNIWTFTSIWVLEDDEDMPIRTCRPADFCHKQRVDISRFGVRGNIVFMFRPQHPNTKRIRLVTPDSYLRRVAVFYGKGISE